jgi:hypothetical protein
LQGDAVVAAGHTGTFRRIGRLKPLLADPVGVPRLCFLHGHDGEFHGVIPISGNRRFFTSSIGVTPVVAEE